MDWAPYFLQLAVMAGVTWLVRMIPLAFFRKQITSVFLKSFLHYVPYAVLGAMTFPGVFFSTGSVWTAAVGVAAAMVMAWQGKGLLTVAITACLAVAAAQGILLLFPGLLPAEMPDAEAVAETAKALWQILCV